LPLIVKWLSATLWIDHDESISTSSRCARSSGRGCAGSTTIAP
jgi:hypothetical protein